MSDERAFLLVNLLLNLGLLAIFILSLRIQNMRWQTWFWWLMLWTLADGVTTYYWVVTAEEANPIARYLFEKFGVLEGLLIHGAIVSIFLLLLGIWKGKTEWIARYTILIIACSHCYAAAWNVAFHFHFIG